MTCYLPPFSLPGILHSIDLGLRSYDSFVALGVSALNPPPVPCSSYILCAICLLHLVCYPFEASHFLGCSRLWVTLLQGSGLLLLSLLPRDPFWRLCVCGGGGPLSATTGSVPVWLRPPRPPSGTGSSTPAPASPAPPWRGSDFSRLVCKPWRRHRPLAGEGAGAYITSSRRSRADAKRLLRAARRTLKTGYCDRGDRRGRQARRCIGRVPT